MSGLLMAILQGIGIGSNMLNKQKNRNIANIHNLANVRYGTQSQGTPAPNLTGDLVKGIAKMFQTAGSIKGTSFDKGVSRLGDFLNSQRVDEPLGGVSRDIVEGNVTYGPRIQDYLTRIQDGRV